VGGVDVSTNYYDDMYGYMGYSDHHAYTDENGAYDMVVSPNSEYDVCAQQSGQFMGNCFDGTVTMEDASAEGTPS